MSVKIVGVNADGTADVVGLAQDGVPIPPQMLDGYPEGRISDNAIRPPGLSIWTVYDHPTDWPAWYVAVEFINDHRTSNMLLYRDLNQLRAELSEAGLVRMMRHESDDPVIMETWL